MAKMSASFRRDGHFADDEWLDFARGQDGAEQRAAPRRAPPVRLQAM